MWTGQGWEVETPRLGTIPVMVGMLLMKDQHPDVVFICCPDRSRHMLARGVRIDSQQAGIPVHEVTPA